MSVDHLSAARAVALHIAHSIEQLLPDNPQLGRPGRVPGIRELVIPKIIVPYRLQRNVIQISRVYHGARLQGLALELALDSVDRIERLAMSAEARRNAAWREINRHRDRKEFARSLHDEVCAIEKAELQSIGTKTIAPVATTERNVA